MNEEEKGKLFRVVEKIAKGARVVAVIAYGSRVSGYAREDSDYDLIVVVERLRPRAKYVYVEEDGLYYSALMVDEEAFRKDCESGYLGEFVGGRLLNRFEPLIGEEYVLQQMLALKKRIILESLRELIERYGPFADQLVVSSEYFLFNKLKKRALLYPPVVYSYIKTYSGEVGRSNLEFSLAGFKRQLEKLCEEGVLMKVKDGYMMTEGAERKIKAYPIASSLRLAKFGVKQYVTHGLAGSVGVDVAFKELVSKIGRAKEKLEMPKELSDPRILLSIQEGRLAFGADWLQVVLEELGIQGEFSHTERPIGEFFSTTTLHTVENRGRTISFVSKKFQDIWSLKWMVASLVALSARTFETRPMYRLANEYKGIIHLRTIGVRTPRILVLAPEEKILVREHVEGVSLEELIKSTGVSSEVLGYVKKFGTYLGRLHQSGMAMGDTKPTNAICKDSDMVIIDLEQAEENGDPAWDVAEFLYYTSTLVSEDDMVKIADSFIEGYLHHGDPKNLHDATGQKYTIPFQVFVQPNTLIAARNRLFRV